MVCGEYPVKNHSGSSWPGTANIQNRQGHAAAIKGTIILFALLSLFFPHDADAQWLPGGNLISQADSAKISLKMISDGAGGMIAVWIGFPNGNPDIYAQKIDADGNPLWMAGGLPICEDPGVQGNIAIAGNGSGGLIVVWEDRRNAGNYEIYQQQVSAAGVRSSWNGNCITISSADDIKPSIIPYYGGGAIVSYIEDHGLVNEWDAMLTQYPAVIRLGQGGTVVYRKRMSGWENRNCRVFRSEGDSYIVSWESFLNGWRFRRMSSDGAELWLGRISTHSYEYYKVIKDGAGGAFIFCNGIDYYDREAELHHLGSDGDPDWPAIEFDGSFPERTVKALDAVESSPGKGETESAVIVLWSDTRVEAPGLYAQRIDRTGKKLWAPGGIQVGDSIPSQGEAQICPDGDGGVFAAWYEGEIRVNHIDREGQLLWGENGTSIRSDNGFPASFLNVAAAPDPADPEGDISSIFAAWADERGGIPDLFATRFTGNDPRPVLDPVGDREVEIGDTLDIILSASSAAPPAELVFSTDAAELLGPAATLDSLTGEFRYIPVLGDQGDHLVTFRVSNGPYIDEEKIIISVFNNGNRPPILDPLQDVSVFESFAAIIEVSATDPDHDDLVFTIDDPRFSLEGGAFIWQTGAGDEGVYEVVVSVSDGMESDSDTCTVTVMLIDLIHDPMSDASNPFFRWVRNNGVWYTYADGWYAGSINASWENAIVSGDPFEASRPLSFTARIFLGNGSNHIFGFSDRSLGEDNFHYANIDHGIYIHSTGSLRPSWDADNAGLWNTIIPGGYYDVRISLDKPGGRAIFEIDQVEGWSSPKSDFAEPLWTSSEEREVGEEYHIQINAYNNETHIYDVWFNVTEMYPPVLEPIGDRSVETGDLFDLQLAAYDANQGDVLTFSTNAQEVLPGEVFFSGTSGHLVWQPQQDDEGVYYLTFAVTDGIFSDSKEMRLTVIFAGNRPPVLASLEDAYAYETGEVIIEVSATDEENDELYFSIDDGRFHFEPGRFVWQTGEGDAGTYQVEVTVSDGQGTDSDKCTVRVLPPDSSHDPMLNAGNPAFDWTQNRGAWNDGDGGYFCGGGEGGWEDAIVSGKACNLSRPHSMVVRIYRSDASNHIFGFSDRSLGEDNFHYENIDHGIYIHSTGSLRPSWDVNNTGFWNRTIGPGYYDVMVSSDPDGGKILFAIDRVEGWDSPMADFADPVWTESAAREFGGDYRIQINPGNISSNVYDLWLFEPENHSPELDPIGDLRADTGQPFELLLSARDEDVGDLLVFSTDAQEVLPGEVYFHHTAGLLRWDPQPGDAGDYGLTFSVTDGIFTVSEEVTLSVFQDGNRPPVLLPRPPSVAYETGELVIEVSAVDPDGDAVFLSIDDGRFVQDENLFTWQAQEGDAGAFEVIITASDGTLARSDTTEVTVFPIGDGRDRMYGPTYPGFLWQANYGIWSSDEDGCFTGDGEHGMENSALSTVPSLPGEREGIVLRIYRGMETFVAGFTESGIENNDFNSGNIEQGLSIQANGSICPSWDTENDDRWDRILPRGLYDIYIGVDPVRGLVTLVADDVDSISSPLSSFTDPLWTVVENRVVTEERYVQINISGSDTKVYDIWKTVIELNSSFSIGAYSAEPAPGRIVVTWNLEGDVEGVSFVIFRAEDSGEFSPLGADVEEDGQSFSFTDGTTLPGTGYRYRVLAKKDQNSTYLFTSEAVEALAPAMVLRQNYPNPFNPLTIISFGLPAGGRARIEVFDAAGRCVAVILDEEMPAGENSVEWDGTTAEGEKLVSGVYFYRLTFGGEEMCRKIVLIR